MADSFNVKVTNPNDVKAGDEVKVVPIVPKGFPFPMDTSAKMGTVKSTTGTEVVVDLEGMEMPIKVPPTKGKYDMNFSVYKKAAGGRRKTRGRKARRYTRRR